MADMTQSERSQMLDKVEKLLRLSQSPNEHEAALAASRVQEILLKYGLSISDVPTSDRPSVSDDAFTTASVPWLHKFLAKLARVYDCRSYRDLGTQFSELHVVGHPHNKEALRLVFNYLSTTIVGLGFAAAQEAHIKGRYLQEYSSSFCIGCSERIVERIRQAKEQIINNSSDVRALVVQYQQEVNKFVDANYHFSHTPINSTVVGAYHAGRAAANSINIHQTIAAPGQRQLK